MPGSLRAKCFHLLRKKSRQKERDLRVFEKSCSLVMWSDFPPLVTNRFGQDGQVNGISPTAANARKLRRQCKRILAGMRTRVFLPLRQAFQRRRVEDFVRTKLTRCSLDVVNRDVVGELFDGVKQMLTGESNYGII